MNAAPPTRVLLVEDRPDLARTYRGFLRSEPYRIVHAGTGADALKAVGEQPPGIILLDLKLPDLDGMDILREVRNRGVDCPVVVITAHGSVEAAVTAMREGASDFLAKPVSAERLRVTVRNLVEKHHLAEVVDTYRSAIDRQKFQGFIGASLIMQGVYRSIESAAASDATVFVTGESGTGKEIAARAVHDLSRRRDGPFIALNCAAIAKDLMESEIFGHVKGAFTGAVSQRDGAARQASGGTLFLDEVCEMDPFLQTKLLRFVQTGAFMRVGSSRSETVEVRFLCATNRDPIAEVKAGRFREDLYYRLHVIPIKLPPLRDRGDDILRIANRFLADYASQEGKAFEAFSEEAEVLLMSNPWPGNVRELQNEVTRMLVLAERDMLSADLLSPHVVRDAAVATQEAKVAAKAITMPDTGPLKDRVERMEATILMETLVRCRWNKSRAAEELGLSRVGLRAKLDRYGIARDDAFAKSH